MRLALSSLLALCFWVMPVLGQSPSTTTQPILQIEDDWLRRNNTRILLCSNEFWRMTS